MSSLGVDFSSHLCTSRFVLLHEGLNEWRECEGVCWTWRDNAEAGRVEIVFWCSIYHSSGGVHRWAVAACSCCGVKSAGHFMPSRQFWAGDSQSRQFCRVRFWQFLLLAFLHEETGLLGLSGSEGETLGEEARMSSEQQALKGQKVSSNR